MKNWLADGHNVFMLRLYSLIYPYLEGNDHFNFDFQDEASIQQYEDNWCSTMERGVKWRSRGESYKTQGQAEDWSSSKVRAEREKMTKGEWGETPS